MKFLVFIFILLFGSLNALAQVSLGKRTFMPENDLHVEDDPLKSNITVNEFNSIIDTFEEYYAPIIAAHGGELVFERRWEDPTVNASAQQQGKYWIVTMYGGLARRPEITPDGFATVVCHELGHHLSGFPWVAVWAGNEGNSDYFATYACERNLWANDPVTDRIDPSDVPNVPRELCDNIWSKSSEEKLCYRTMMGGKSTADLLAALNNQTISWFDHDKSQVSRTNNSHPRAQCRLDTYMAGSLCQSKWSDPLIPQTEKDTHAISCTRFVLDDSTARDDIKRGFKPRCWFFPKDLKDDPDNPDDPDDPNDPKNPCKVCHSDPHDDLPPRLPICLPGDKGFK